MAIILTQCLNLIVMVSVLRLFTGIQQDGPFRRLFPASWPGFDDVATISLSGIIPVSMPNDLRPYKKTKQKQNKTKKEREREPLTSRFIKKKLLVIL